MKILLVEDNDADIALMRLAFQTEFDIAHSGEEALDLINRNNYDLVLLDLGLPLKSGLDVLDEVDRCVKIVVLTASTQDVQRAYELGCNAYVQKPRNLEEVYKVAKAIETFWSLVC